jgi:hypothetical protein
MMAEGGRWRYVTAISCYVSIPNAYET